MASPIRYLFLVLFATAQLATAQPTPTDSLPARHRIISKGGDAGEYQAFPDACRLHNGDIVVVFYAGYGHISYHTEAYPKAGRICLVRSSDEGRTWTRPQTIYDDFNDNRDPHINQLRNGTLVVSLFSLLFDPVTKKDYRGTNPQLIWSRDGGRTWSDTAQTVPTGDGWYCSAKVKPLSRRKLLLPVYYQKGKASELKAWGGVVESRDRGKTWGAVVPIGQAANLPLAAETEVVTLKDGTLFAALRAQRDVSMHMATSPDRGWTWSAVQPFGWVGHAPSFTRLKSGVILLTYRGFEKGGEWKTAYTALRLSRDEGKTWEGPFLLDRSGGGYPSTIELKDGSVLAIFYEEGEKSGVRAVRFAVPPPTSASAGGANPKEIRALPLE
jgi:sialidase-1